MLVAFFVNIGFAGLPTTYTLIGGLMLLLLLPIQGAGYWVLLAASGMRHRTSLLTGALLTSYSEFALIVAALGVEDGWLEQEWLVKLAVAVAASFVIAAILNPRNTSALSSFAARFPTRPPEKLNIHDRPIEIGNVTALVLGMGRVGSAAYQQLTIEHGLEVLGVEHDPKRVALLEKLGNNIVEGDATDTDFWDRVIRNGLIEVIVLAMPEHHANIDALMEIRQRKFTGRVAAVAMYYEDVRELHDLGIDVVVHMYAGAGRDLADQSMEIEKRARDDI
ncbi:NAD-binding protein [Bowdeniella nasicola]|uniref:NAD-binding protein n=1 Tax=Bowdeniella nasicola TaxID=208480 RepID=UPI000B0BA305|nr:cation:proton antiporter family protein [Bowdeniella nasicola]